MRNQTDTGIFQLENGMWAYRYTFTREGKRYSRQGRKDENGEPLKNKRAAVKVRKIALEREVNPPVPIVESGITVREVYLEYCENGRNDRAYQTIRKQDSLWANHLCERFGKRSVSSISVAEINDYLSELYYVEKKEQRRRHSPYIYMQSNIYELNLHVNAAETAKNLTAHFVIAENKYVY